MWRLIIVLCIFKFKEILFFIICKLNKKISNFLKDDFIYCIVLLMYVIFDRSFFFIFVIVVFFFF